MHVIKGSTPLPVRHQSFNAGLSKCFAPSPTITSLPVQPLLHLGADFKKGMGACFMISVVKYDIACDIHDSPGVPCRSHTRTVYHFDRLDPNDISIGPFQSENRGRKVLESLMIG